MTSSVETPDVEALALSILNPMGVHVSTRVPHKRPERFIRASLAGGGEDSIFDTPRILVECFAPSTVDASELARKARLQLQLSQFDVVGDWQLYGVSADYPTYFPDEAAERYQFLAEIRVRKH